MTRKPVAAGTFYSDNLGELDKQIKECFIRDVRGPGDLPVDRRDKKIIGVIAPHAGYQFSGACQAWSYKEIGESEFADTYVILGTSHAGFPEAATVVDDFETPFGIVNVDTRFIKSLMEKCVVIESKVAHQQEHSIEVQLPFLQFVNKDHHGVIQIVPIVVGKDTNYEKLGKAIADTAKEIGKKVVLICSSDFTHHGIHYGYVPFRRHPKEKMKELDLSLIMWIKKLDSWGFINNVEETKSTVCGAYAIAAFIEACKAMSASKVRL